ncbi:MAG TPA: KUP/HAK/KT family potassium transporter, partial [Caulobacteraceae bacterium]
MAGDTPGADPAKGPTPQGSVDGAPDIAKPAPTEAPDDGHGHATGRNAFLLLALGAIGVVFGDIGTSPLYALREALGHAGGGGGVEANVLGVISLVIWTMTLIVTVKYVWFFMRADNKGEGGTLALMALAQRALGKRSSVVFV